jgi:pimeloyl-ACP methyl ester carboxylesterase
MLVWGENDHVIPVKHGREAHKMMMPHSRFELVPGAGHFAHNDDPQKFVSLLSDFIAETDAAELSEEQVRGMLLQS